MSDRESRKNVRGTLDRISTARTVSGRHKTLTLLEETLRLLTDRYGARATLGEILAITAAMARLCKTDRVTVAEIAEATGLRKQNVSRWAQKRVGQSIQLQANEDDRRIKEVVLVDPNQGQEYLEKLAKILGADGG